MMSKFSLSRSVNTLKNTIARFRKNESGTSILEFAIVAPFLATLFLGFVELARADHVSARIGQVSAIVSDLISQSPLLSVEQIDAALLAAQAVAGASAAEEMAIEVVGVTIFNNGSTKVEWARGVNTNGLPAKGSSFPLPVSLLAQPGFIVASRTHILHVPKHGHSIVGDISLESKNYYVPRSSDITNCSNC